MQNLLGLCGRSPGLDRVVELAHRHLGLDVVFIAELTGEGQTYRAVAGDGRSFGIRVGATSPASAAAAGGDESAAAHTERLLAGTVPNLVHNLAGDGRVVELAADGARVGSCIGAPLRLSDGTAYGMLGALSRRADLTLDERDVRFLMMLAELIRGDLDDQRRRELLRDQIAALLERGGVGIAYQPIVDTRRDRCLGVEALARFPHPFERPLDALAAAREVGLDLELERLAVSAAWPMLDRLEPDQFLALNVSPASLVELARRAQLRPELALDRVVVEVTEHAVIDTYHSLRCELRPLRDRGLRIAVDDAGAGYASLRHVLKLTPDFIKIDRSLIHGVAGDPAGKAAVGAFVSLAHHLGATVVAEGVERADDLDAVRELGVDAAQGYLLGRPNCDADAVAELACTGAGGSAAPVEPRLAASGASR